MLKKLIIGVILNATALYGVIYFVPGIQYTGGVVFFIIGGFVMGIVNSIIKPVLKLITFPLQIITMGLSLIILNGVIFWIFHQIIDTIAVQGVTLNVDSLKTYVFAGLIFGLINWAEHLVIRNK